MALEIQEQVPLASYSTFRIGGPARYFVTVTNQHEMAEALRFAKQNALRVFVVGRGSNSLFDDRGFNGLVIHNRIEFFEDLGNGRVHVGSGYSFAHLGIKTARAGWAGLEFASGIPASVGGALFMNAGANGRETCDALEWVEWMEMDGTVRRIPRDQLEFAYRSSPFQKMEGALLAAQFQLESDPEARKRQLEIVAYRTATQPYGQPSAGCIFRNPEGGHAGRLIEQAGLKGVCEGGAQVSPLHANFIVGGDQATAEQVERLIDRVRQKVEESSGVQLQPEVRVIPYE